jgi:hypothetical protein
MPSHTGQESERTVFIQLAAALGYFRCEKHPRQTTSQARGAKATWSYLPNHDARAPPGILGLLHACGQRGGSNVPASIASGCRLSHDDLIQCDPRGVDLENGRLGVASARGRDEASAGGVFAAL